jgi:hypothetical protein
VRRPRIAGRSWRGDVTAENGVVTVLEMVDEPRRQVIPEGLALRVLGTVVQLPRVVLEQVEIF